jgi:hypothetical protein
MQMLEDRVNELKAIIAGNDGRNAADARFSRAVDELVSAVFDDIGRILDLPPRALFDLFLIKVLYVGRRTTHADVIDYLGELLDACLYTRATFPHGTDGRPRTIYYSDLLDDEKRAEIAASRFEAYRAYADHALFLTGIFPGSVGVQRRPAGMLRQGPRRGVDRAYYVTTGAAMYRMAAAHDSDENTHRRMTFDRLASGFAFYADALNEMSDRYIMGKDREMITDKLLDSINHYRATGDAARLDAARRYAAMLEIDPAQFPG